MNTMAVVGANWGDEGKGKFVDVFAADADFVVRFQGGNNAGHTIINDYGKFSLHLLPSGVFFEHTVNVIGPGVVVDVAAFFEEMEGLKMRGVPEPCLVVSDRSHVVMPYHGLFDRLEEERLAGGSFGSTQKGISQVYADKCLKMGFQTNELLDEDLLRGRLEMVVPLKNVLLKELYGVEVLDVEELVAEMLGLGKRLEPYLCDTALLLEEGRVAGKRILLEGQLGSLRDPDHGVYPYPTSSSPLAGNACVGAGIAPSSLGRIVAVVKAYSTCVGACPFVTELFDEYGEDIRRLGGDAGEYGATTGRARRVGWFDAVATRYGVRVQQATEVVLTNLDVLSAFEEIPVCVGYEVDEELIRDFPVTRVLAKARPVYEMMTGWGVDITGVRQFEDLPMEAREYVEYVERVVGVFVKWVSVGPKREQVIEREDF